MTETCVLPVGQQVENCTVSAVTTLVAAPTSTPSPAAAFVMPGTSIQVLPVGLGIYGGITAAAVVVVVLVTVERVRDRKVRVVRVGACADADAVVQRFRRQRMRERGPFGVSKG